MILGRPARASAWWDNVLADMAIMLDIRHLQISYNTPCLPAPHPPQIFHNLCLSFLLGITAVPREIKNM